nr:retrovirus-related Pol polyprotein from transposon TNT 1-94 [Tanacetum cinerariifolium]
MEEYIRLEEEKARRHGKVYNWETAKYGKICQMHNNIMAAGSRDRPPILAPGRYPQWRSRFLRYVDTRPNGEALRKCILSGPYKPTTVLVQVVEATDNSPVEMWEAIERLQQGESLNIQDVKTNLFWEFGKFTSHDGESMESYYTRFYKMMNEMIRNKLTVTTIQVNVQFLQQLQPEWSRFVTIVKQQHKLDEVSYHKLFDILKQYQSKVNELRAEKLARNANPLALVATAQASQDPFYQTSRSHRSSAPSPKPSILSRSHTTTRYKGNEIAKPITPPSETTSEEDSNPEQAQRDKDMQQNLGLIAKYFKKIYKPTTNNLKTSSNSKNKNVNTTSRFKNGGQSGQFGTQRMMNVAGPRENVGSKVVQQYGIQCFNCREYRHFAKECRKPKRYDWLADTDEEVVEQELEANYSYMAKIQEVPTADSDTDSEPVEQVQNETGYNVFANHLQHSDQSKSVSNTCLLETDDGNVTPDSPDMCEADIKTEQNDVESDDERVALANLIANLKLDTKQAEFEKFKAFNDRTVDYDKIEQTLALKRESRSKLNKDSVRPYDYNKLNSLYEIFKPPTQEYEIQLAHGNEIRREMWRKSFAKSKLNIYKNVAFLPVSKSISKSRQAYNVMTNNFNHFKQICDDSWTKHSKDLFRALTALDIEILIQTCLMPLAIKTQGDSLKFVHELKQEMHADLKYVESLEKEIDELESKKAEFLDMYDVILQDCVSKDVMCSYLQSLSNLDALAELQCMYLHKVKECDCLAQRFSKQTESGKEQVKNNIACNEKASNGYRKEREQYIEIQDLKAKLQDKNIAISELTKLIEKGKGKSVDTKFDRPSTVRQPNAQRIPKPSVLGKPTPFLNSLDRILFQKRKSVSKDNVSEGLSKPVTAQTLPQAVKKDHMTGNLKLLCNFVEKFLGTVRFGNDQFAPILGYGDLVQRNVTINQVYYIEGLNHNLFSVCQFCVADLEVAFRKSTCFVRDLQGNDLLIGNHGSDLYTISLQESTSSTPLCLMAKATPTQAWLWHQRLSHLNFDYINLLSKKDIVIGLPKLKYVKDQLCSSCELSKAKRSSFKSKAVPSSKGRLNLLHMDYSSGKKYIMVIVDDYSRYTWTMFLHSKDETPEVLKDFLTMIQRNLQAPVINVRTDRGTEFLNKTLNAFFKEEGIEHQTWTA